MFYKKKMVKEKLIKISMKNDGEMNLYFVHLIVLFYKDKKFL